MQRFSDVIESVGGVVQGQQLLEIYFDAEKITYSVLVLHSIQPSEDRAAFVCLSRADQTENDSKNNISAAHLPDGLKSKSPTVGSAAKSAITCMARKRTLLHSAVDSIRLCGMFAINVVF